MDKQQRQELNEIISSCYDDILASLYKQYSYADNIYGEPLEDLLQSAVKQFLRSVKNKGGEQFTSKICENYVRKSIMNNVRHVMSTKKKKLDYDKKFKSDVKDLFSFENSGDPIELSEYQDLINSLGPKCRTFIRLRVREDANIMEVREKLNIGSMREYYELKENIEEILKKRGIDEY